MDEDYSPPPMFGKVEKPKINKAPSKPKYFKPPIPPKRPKSFKMSLEMLEHLKSRKSVNSQPKNRPNIGADITNDTGNDIRIMNADDIYDSINR